MMRPFTPPKIPQVTSFPPPNPEEGLAYRRIKSKLRGGMGAGRGDNPHGYDSDPTPPYGLPRPKQ